MKLFKYDNFELTVSEEALLIEAFRKLWNRDRSSNKSRALSELGYIYFMYDPRSDYMFIMDDKERSKVILEQQGLKSNYKIDKVMEEAIRVYQYLTQTAASILLQDTKIAVDRFREYLKDIDFSRTDGNGKPIHTLNSVTSTIRQILELAQKLVEVEKAVSKEIEEESRMRGQGLKKIFEDGFTS